MFFDGEPSVGKPAPTENFAVTVTFELLTQKSANLRKSGEILTSGL